MALKYRVLTLEALSALYYEDCPLLSPGLLPLMKEQERRTAGRETLEELKSAFLKIHREFPDAIDYPRYETGLLLSEVRFLISQGSCDDSRSLLRYLLDSSRYVQEHPEFHAAALIEMAVLCSKTAALPDNSKTAALSEYSETDKLSEMEASLSEAEALCRENHLSIELAVTGRLFGTCYRMRGSRDKAVCCLQEAAERFSCSLLDAEKCALNTAACYRSLEEIYLEEGNSEEAEACRKKAGELFIKYSLPER